MNQGNRCEPVHIKNHLSATDFEKLLELIKPIKYGSVTLVIQDGRVVQIDKNEKVRLR